MGYTTGKKEKIIELLSAHAGETYTLEEICDKILDGESGRSTVYRIVSELVADGCLRRISDGMTRHCAYQYIGDCSCHGHLHLKCKECGRLIHLDEKLSHELESSLLSVGGFAIEKGTLLFGNCLDCIGGAV